jgi:hypothetical protein
MERFARHYRVSASRYTDDREEFRQVYFNAERIEKAWTECLRLRSFGFDAYIAVHTGNDWWQGLPDLEG